jgi:RNA 3'-phosphate cyclase
MIEIDGAYGSGGGAVLRTATALSAVTGKPIHVSNIRKGRPNPGLKTQHLEGLRAIAKLCNGKLKGDELRSMEIELHPEKIQNDDLEIKIGTAGSIGLLFQSLKIPACKAEGPVNIRIKGGATFGRYAPPTPYAQSVLLPVLRQTGYSGDINIIRHGFFPVGGADVSFHINPCKEFKPLNLTERGEIETIKGVSIASTSLKKPRVADRQAGTAAEILKKHGFDPEIKTSYADSSCPGSGVVLSAKTTTGCVLGADSLGERGKKAEEVGGQAAHNLLSIINSKATADERLSDQLLVFMALAKGKSSIITPRFTNHSKTNIWVIEKFLDTRFHTEPAGKNIRIGCSGLSKQLI